MSRGGLLRRAVRRKEFKHLRVTVLSKKEAELEAINYGGVHWIPLPVKPKKLAKELRKIARWLEKRA